MTTRGSYTRGSTKRAENNWRNNLSNGNNNDGDVNWNNLQEERNLYVPEEENVDYNEPLGMDNFHRKPSLWIHVPNPAKGRGNPASWLRKTLVKNKNKNKNKSRAGNPALWLRGRKKGGKRGTKRRRA
jgi:hypothetical protein